MNHHFTLACQIDMATRELAAFLHVVSELYGPEEADLSAQDWLDEFDSIDCISELTERDWRLITIAAANRLSKRVSKQVQAKTAAL